MKFYHSAATALRTISREAIPDDFAEVEARYPFLANDYYLSLIDPADPDDPVRRQLFPDRAELADAESEFDPLAEARQMPVPRLIRRFDDRAVLLTTSRCAMHCRFCFRKRFWASDLDHPGDLTEKELAAVAGFLRRTPEIREVLLSGGDPLMLPFDKLRHIIGILREIPSLFVLRVGSRMPVVLPERVTQEIADYLGSVPGLWFLTHFNHVNEATDAAMAACARLIRAGVPVLNQTVLLRGVNDTPEKLEALFRKLIAHRVKPHYLFHVDPVRGVRHFATGIDRGLEILRAFRPRLSSLAVPTFAIDLPGGGGKVALQPDYRDGDKFRDIRDTRSIAYEIKKL